MWSRASTFYYHEKISCLNGLFTDLPQHISHRFFFSAVVPAFNFAFSLSRSASLLALRRKLLSGGGGAQEEEPKKGFSLKADSQSAGFKHFYCVAFSALSGDVLRNRKQSFSLYRWL
jgi:hypothetical protein